MGSERPCQASRLLPRKRYGLAISGQADKEPRLSEGRWPSAPGGMMFSGGS